MSTRQRIILAIAVVAVAAPFAAQANGNAFFGHQSSFFSALSGGQEVPAISTTGRGKALLRVGASTFADAAGDNASIGYVVGWDGLEGDVLQAHLHFGARGTNGGVIAFLCSNLDSAPEGVDACPQRGVLHGRIGTDGIVGPGGQGIAPGELGEVIRALREGNVYINVHTSLHPSGEIRGQVHRRFGVIDPLFDPTVVDVETFIDGITDIQSR